MKRKRIYINLTKVILDDFSGLGKDSDEYQDINDYISGDYIAEALDSLKTASTLSPELHPIIDTCKSVITGGELDLEEEIGASKYKILLFDVTSEPRYSRNIKYISSSLCVVATQHLYVNSGDTYSRDMWFLLEYIFIDNKRMKRVLKDLVKKENSDTFICLCDKSLSNLSNEQKIDNIYAYALLSSINKKDLIDIPYGLVYVWGTSPIVPAISYNPDIVYQEYYEIYDVFNDWLHAKDILTAFLRMYQIAEYMIYRMLMVDIVNRSDIKQSFLRETKNLSDKFTRGERATIIEKFCDLFNGFTLDSSEVTASWTFVDKYFGLSKSGVHYLNASSSQQEIDKGVARFIYDVRCSIVHNKESEFHILYNNYDEYESIVPLMKCIHEQMAEKIINILNTVSSKIHYTNQNIKLY